MIELWDNLFQLLINTIGAVTAFVWYRRDRRQAYFLTGCFYSCMALGLCYWTLYVGLTGNSPQIFYVSNMVWLSGYLFLIMLEEDKRRKEEKKQWSKLSFLILIMSILLFLVYARYGDVLMNALECMLLGVVADLAARGLHFLKQQPTKEQTDKRLYEICLLFVGLEHCLWLSSCFWKEGGSNALYFFFDGLLSISMGLLLFAVRRAVKR